AGGIPFTNKANNPSQPVVCRNGGIGTPKRGAPLRMTVKVRVAVSAPVERCATRQHQLRIFQSLPVSVPLTLPGSAASSPSKGALRKNVTALGKMMGSEWIMKP